MSSSWKTTVGRAKALATGRVVWEDPLTGETEAETMSWRDRWTVFGVHSYNWAWVRRLGARDCGCTFNPLTRRKLLTRMDCPDHGLDWAELKGCDDNPKCCCGTGFSPGRLSEPEPPHRPLWHVIIDGEIEDVYLDDEGDEIVVSGTCRLSRSEAVGLAETLTRAAAALTERNPQ